MTYPVATNVVGKIGMLVVYASLFVVVATGGLGFFLQAL